MKTIKDYIPKGFKIDETRKIQPSNTTTKENYFVISVPIIKIKTFKDYIYNYIAKDSNCIIKKIFHCNPELNNPYIWPIEHKLSLYLYICNDLNINWQTALYVLSIIYDNEHESLYSTKTLSIIPTKFLKLMKKDIENLIIPLIK
jgi:hypothetical protein